VRGSSEEAMNFRTIIFFAATGVALAQSNGTITGAVTGLNGTMANVSIEARNVATGAVFNATSSANGSYALGQLPPGSYVLLVRTGGYLDFRRTVAVAPSETVHVDIGLLSVGGGTLTGGGGRRRRPDPPSGPAPRGPDGKPDLSAVWSSTVRSFDWGKPDLLPETEALVEQRLANGMSDHPSARCLPSGVGPGQIMFTPRFRLVYTPSFMTILIEETVRTYRDIYLDGRDHPKDMHPTWLGHSIGKWDGDTLVVDTTGFNGKIWLDLPANSALPSTERLHVTERYRRVDLGHLELEITIDDPGAYRTPWVVKGVSELAVNEVMDENICNENNKAVEHLGGK
jgi:hypothetical protein